MLQKQKHETNQPATPTVTDDPRLQEVASKVQDLIKTIEAETPANPYSEIFNKAADYIEKYGWTKGRLQKGTGRGPVCFVGAIGKAVFGEDAIPNESSRAWYILDAVRFANRTFIPGFGTIHNWNDSLVNEPEAREKVIKELRNLANLKID